MLSWEFPPLVVGGIAAHVDGLATGHAAPATTWSCSASHHARTSADDPRSEGVRVLRATRRPAVAARRRLVARMASANHQARSQLARPPAALEARHRARPRLAGSPGPADTLATPVACRSSPRSTPPNAAATAASAARRPRPTINSIEWWLTFQAERVIACSRFMVERGRSTASNSPPRQGAPGPNGVDHAAAGRRPTARTAAPTRAARRVVGQRPVREGLPGARPGDQPLRHRVPDIRCVIAGRGELPARAAVADRRRGRQRHRRPRRLRARRRAALACCTGPACVVIPSLYEPFGIVALEGTGGRRAD